MEKAYEWYDGYIFLHGNKRWVDVCELWANDKVRYPAHLEPDDGDDPDRLLVFVDVRKDEKDAEKMLKKKIDDVVALANPSFATGTSKIVGTNAPTRWSKKLDWGAFVRVTAEKGQEMAVFERLLPMKAGGEVPDEAYYGHALCDSEYWDVLLELGAESKRALVPLAEAIRSVRGVSSVLVNRHKNHIYKPERPLPGSCKDSVAD